MKQGNENEMLDAIAADTGEFKIEQVEASDGNDIFASIIPNDIENQENVEEISDNEWFAPDHVCLLFNMSTTCLKNV